MVLTFLRRACAVAFCTLSSTQIEAAEKLISTNLDTRTVLAFRVPNEVVRKLLPAGWELDAAPDGPNLRVVFANNLLVQDAEGKASENLRVVTLTAQAKSSTEEKAGIALGGFLSAAAAVPGPYFNYSAASAVFSQRVGVNGAGKSVIEEAWEFRGSEGDALDLKIQFERGPLARVKANTKTYSSSKPDFFRIYRIEQAVDVINASSGRNRLAQMALKASGPLFGSILDGSEQLVSVTSIPYYARQIYLPEP
ncbi:hypothetical protein LRP30_41445 [Bradyrhizobium sp. C-145]|uniref:hypothetical protein n=1 Tax=Bradyrhizobium sp. C-145 TaxID=574727 RepID=UPI00201B9587|nr:hypothetical protein [Bradyrhizobium sp. C-145]UQR63118.1 hypothetical protein LRP30_41445 [Bradyrhizobium sp. C-145]